MRGLMILALTFTAGEWKALAQSDLNAESNVSCVGRLRMPVCSRLADAARISGSVTAIVMLASDGSIQNTTMEWGTASAVAKGLFPPSVEQAFEHRRAERVARVSR